MKKSCSQLCCFLPLNYAKPPSLSLLSTRYTTSCVYPIHVAARKKKEEKKKSLWSLKHPTKNAATKKRYYTQKPTLFSLFASAKGSMQLSFSESFLVLYWSLVLSHVNNREKNKPQSGTQRKRTEKKSSTPDMYQEETTRARRLINRRHNTGHRNNAQKKIDLFSCLASSFSLNQHNTTLQPRTHTPKKQIREVQMYRLRIQHQREKGRKKNATGH